MPVSICIAPDPGWVVSPRHGAPCWGSRLPAKAADHSGPGADSHSQKPVLLKLFGPPCLQPAVQTRTRTTSGLSSPSWSCWMDHGFCTQTIKTSSLAGSHMCGWRNTRLATSRNKAADFLGTNYTQEIYLVWFMHA